eukprot:TRINITY_DN33853_c0_g1_i1.p1 TRINITY_DN33853_c0_g1~~TRINITY_DN33853_c0_g1_i1.p1  ORF type:complete len:126 (+),score=10.21 TRINITY_DN33853_c0_g1_i1:55-378(+)
MIFEEDMAILFDAPVNVNFAHCVSRDLKNVRGHCPHLPCPVRSQKLHQAAKSKCWRCSKPVCQEHVLLYKRWYHEKPTLTNLKTLSGIPPQHMHGPGTEKHSNAKDR